MTSVGASTLKDLKPEMASQNFMDFKIEVDHCFKFKHIGHPYRLESLPFQTVIGDPVSYIYLRVCMCITHFTLFNVYYCVLDSSS